MRVVADGTACLNRCVLAALFAPLARAPLLCAAATSASASMCLILRDLQLRVFVWHHLPTCTAHLHQILQKFERRHQGQICSHFKPLATHLRTRS
jgi:hypothetical protein